MYLRYFALLRYPFAGDIPPDEMYASAGMDELNVRLGHLTEMSGIGLVTGDCGSGKSTACRAMTARLHTGLYKVFYVPLSTGNPMDLYKSIAWEMGLPTERSRASLYRQIRNEVTRLLQRRPTTDPPGGGIVIHPGLAARRVLVRGKRSTRGRRSSCHVATRAWIGVDPPPCGRTGRA